MEPQPTSPTQPMPIPRSRGPIITAIIVGILLLTGAVFAYTKLTNKPAPSPTPTPTQNAVQYRNEQYGFAIPLTDAWQGYTVQMSTWNGIVFDAKGNQTGTDHGPEIIIHYPGTAAHETMPIMVFTPSQWALVSAGDTNPAQPFMSVGAAPFGPSLLGRNSRYTLALPARYNYDYQPGFEEVDQLVHRLTAFEPSTSLKTYTNNQYGFSFQYPPTFPFEEGMSASNAYYVYEVPGPRGDGEVIAEVVVIPANNFKTDIQSEPLHVKDVNQIAASYNNPSYTKTLFQTNSGLSGLRVASSNFSSYYILKGNYVYAFQDLTATSDDIISSVAKSFK